MNKVDQHIKEMMLKHPLIFPTRLACLRRIFMVNGNGYEWDDQGCLRSWSQKNDTKELKMQYSDLDNRDDEQFKYGYSDIAQFQSLCTEQERMLRKFREEHIDLFCQFNDIDDNIKYSDLQYFSPEWSMFRDAPYGNIDPDWLNAAEELIGKIKYAFNIIWSLHYDNPLRGEKAADPSMYSRMPEQFQKLYDQVKEIDDKLDAQSGKRAQHKEFLDMVINNLTD